ncbi:hypothetical protein WA577_000209 [Blastocystis sp. JDR]
MFKAKRHHGSLRKVEEEKDTDTGISVDVEKIKLEQRQRNEVKAGMNAEDLVKPLVLEEDEDPSKKVESSPGAGDGKEPTEEDKLKACLKDDTILYKPEGFGIPSLVPKLHPNTYMRKEVEQASDGHKETIEELLELKRKLTKELKRERRERFEAKF